MNRFEFIGRLTKDPEMTTTNNGINVARFTVAVNRKQKNDDGEQVADFFNITAWRKLAETVNQYCKKGRRVYLAGEVQNRSWDKQDGTKGYATDFVAYECEFLDSKENTTNEAPKKEEFTPVNDDDLPF